jgi:hypothetical protein
VLPEEHASKFGESVWAILKRNEGSAPGRGSSARSPRDPRRGESQSVVAAGSSTQSASSRTSAAATGTPASIGTRFSVREGLQVRPNESLIGIAGRAQVTTGEVEGLGRTPLFSKRSSRPAPYQRGRCRRGRSDGAVTGPIRPENPTISGDVVRRSRSAIRWAQTLLRRGFALD